MGLNLGICGVGSLASLFAAKLASLGSDSPVRVHMIGNWEDQIQHINQHGLSLISATDSIKDIRVSALHWQDCPQLDIAIVLNKSYQTEATAKYLANRMSKSGLVITLQNGLGNTDVLKSYIDCKVLSGLTSEAANRPRLGAVVHAGTGKTIIESSMHPLMATLLNILVRAGFDVESSSRIENEIWNKLLINIAINPLTAIFDIKNGQLLEDDVLISVACDAAVEVAAVANKLGLPIADIESTIKSVCRNTAENHSSMLQDIKSGRETEIDSLCGAVVRYGEKLDVATQLNHLLKQCVKSFPMSGEAEKEDMRFTIRRIVSEVQREAV